MYPVAGDVFRRTDRFTHLIGNYWDQTSGLITSRVVLPAFDRSSISSFLSLAVVCVRACERSFESTHQSKSGSFNKNPTLGVDITGTLLDQ